jgi:hypothetical protein
MLLRQATVAAFALARERAGKSIAARIAMIAMTTRSSINVNARPLANRFGSVLADDLDCSMLFMVLPCPGRAFSGRPKRD